MLLDLNHRRTLDLVRREEYSKTITDCIDGVANQAARLQRVEDIMAHIAVYPPVDDERAGRSVSASMVGDECARRVQYGIWPTFHPEQPVQRAALDAKTLAIFERGHRTEEAMAEWMIWAGFRLETHVAQSDEDIEDGIAPRQFGFSVADGQIKGYADGLLQHFLPNGALALWENKTVGDRSWRAIQRHGIIKQTPKYDAQAQLLMSYMDADATLFTVLNADTGAIYAELLEFDQLCAQAVSDRAVHILQATRAGDLLPRVSSGADKFPCKMCSRYRDACWE